MKMNAWDFVRVVNVRGESEHMATEDEKVIVGHRANPVLGNKHPMKEKSMKERDRVIEAHKKDLYADLEVKGPIYQTLQNIAQEIVEKEQKFAISCHCAPVRCHNDLIIPVIVKMVEEILQNNKEFKSKFKP